MSCILETMFDAMADAVNKQRKFYSAINGELRYGSNWRNVYILMYGVIWWWGQIPSNVGSSCMKISKLDPSALISLDARSSFVPVFPP